MGSPTDSDQSELQSDHASIWMETTETTTYSELEEDVEVDVAVLRGGITGITVAAELKDAGKSVAVVERDRIVKSVTGHTTAKLTSLHGLIYNHLVENFGEEQARQYAEANQSAIDYVESMASDHDIDCHSNGGLRTPIPGITVNGSRTRSMPHNVSISPLRSRNRSNFPSKLSERFASIRRHNFTRESTSSVSRRRYRTPTVTSSKIPQRST